jgi:chitin disaccharide deacetylase
MVGAPATAAAVALARRLPSLRVGLHLTLTGAEPVLSTSAVPDLVDERGRFRKDMARAGAAMFFLPHVKRQMRAEVRAQFEAYRATGLPLDHVTGHEHFHLHPSISSVILELAQEFGNPPVRTPLEPIEVLSQVEAQDARRVSIFRAVAHLQRARLRRASLPTPDHVFGLAWSGAMTQSRLAGLIAHLPEGVSEIYAHPATRGGFVGAAPDYRYEEELEALSSPDLRRQVVGAGVASGGFSDAARFCR